jgi:hypothetical protein
VAGEARGAVGSNEPEAAHSVRGMGAPLFAASTRPGRQPVAGEGKQRFAALSWPHDTYLLQATLRRRSGRATASRSCIGVRCEFVCGGG